MCDCYIHKCEGCGCDISIHIADYCTPRENIHPYCPRCTRKIKKQGLPCAEQYFTDTVTTGGKYSEVEGGKKGQEVIILCDDRKAYGVSLNMNLLHGIEAKWKKNLIRRQRMNEKWL